MADLAADLQCSGCVGVSEMKFDGDVDFGAHAIKAAKVTAAQIVAQSIAATTFVGDGSKLTGLNLPAGQCAKGQAVTGIKADGSLQCGAPLTPALPPDGLDEVSNKLLSNQFTESAASTKTPIGIADNNPKGVQDTVVVPDFGVAQALSVHLKLNNSDLSKLTAQLLDPAGKLHVLYDKSGSGKVLTASWPPTKQVSGDLSAWTGKNPQGKWTLTVIDNGFTNNKLDGAIDSWSIQVSTLSSKKVAATGNLWVQGTLHEAGGAQMQASSTHPYPCTAARFGGYYANNKTMALYICNGQSWRPFDITEPPKVARAEAA